MKNALFYLFTLLIANVTIAQNPDFEWVTGLGGGGSDVSRAVCSDDAGNVYTTGSFASIVDFDPGVGVFNMTAGGTSDVFIQKLNSNGDLVWAKGLIASTTFDSRGNSICLSPSGDIYVVGSYSGTIDFDPGIGVFNMTSGSAENPFVLKLDASGNFVWARSFDGTYGSCLSIDVDDSGNIYTTGYFDGTVDFDPGVGTYNLTTNASSEIFVQKMDPSGNFLWAKTFVGTSYAQGSSISLDSFGNVYTTGYFRGTVDFDPSAGTYNLDAFSDTDIFIQKMDASGNFLWAKSFGQWNVSDEGKSIDVDSFGNIYITGSFEGTADFDPGVGVYNLSSAGSGDVFIQKLDSLGNFLWAKSFGSTGGDVGQSITSDTYGNVYTTGYFDWTVDFDPGAGTYDLTGATDIFIQKLDSLGNFLWAESFGWDNWDVGHSITVDPLGKIYTTGQFMGVVDFDPSGGVSNLSSYASGIDGFTLKLSQCQPTTGTDIQSACDSYTWIDGNTYTADNNTATFVLPNAGGCDSTVTLNLTMTYSNSGTDTHTACDTYDWIDGNTYTSSNNTATFLETNIDNCDSLVTLDLTINYSTTATDVHTECESFTWIDGNTYTANNNTATYVISNQAGCDSTITLDLIINPLPDNNVTQTGSLLEADQTGATYQWLDCDDNDAIIAGATSQDFTPTPVTGNYAVEVTLNGCVDTSACYLVDYTGITEKSIQLSIYPNPTNDGMVNIEYDGKINSITVLDMTGRAVAVSVDLNEKVIDGSKLESGNYLLHIDTDRGVLVEEITIMK